MARAFNGTTQAIDAGNVANVTGTAITVACWAYITTLGVTTKQICRWDDTNGVAANTIFQYLVAVLNTNKAFWQTGNGTANSTTNPSITGATTLSANTWYHIAGVQSGTTGTLYLNGVSDGTNASWSLAIGSASINLTVGAGRNTGAATPYDNFFAGNIADAAVWNVALTVAELSALAKGARPGTIRPLSLQEWLPLDGLQSPEPDLSGKAANGTLVGSPTLAAGPPLMMLTPRWPQFNFPFVAPSTKPFPPFQLRAA